MLLTTGIPPAMENKPESAPASHHRSLTVGKAARRREQALAPRGRRPRTHKTVRLAQTHGKKEGAKEVTPEREEVTVEKDRTARCASTVVDVDGVRGEEESEECVGLLETVWQEEGVKHRNLGVCEWLLMVLALTMVLLFLPLSIWFCVKVVKEHERAVIFRLGHLLRGRPRGPGLLFYLPFVDVCQKVDIRLKMLKVPPHMVVTRDLVTSELSAVCYYRVENVALCSTALSGLTEVLQALVQVADRDVLAHHDFTHILLDRKQIAREIQVAVDSVACQWGLKVERAEIEDISLPVGLQHRLAAESEAKRQAQIKVLAAEGERAACEALRASLDSLTGCPPAVQLRLLQLLQQLHLQSDLQPRTPDLQPPSPDLQARTPELQPLTPELQPPDLQPQVPPAGGAGTREGRQTDSPMM